MEYPEKEFDDLKALQTSTSRMKHHRQSLRLVGCNKSLCTSS